MQLKGHIVFTGFMFAPLTVYLTTLRTKFHVFS